jgi:hypothetical protein
VLLLVLATCLPPQQAVLEHVDVALLLAADVEQPVTPAPTPLGGPEPHPVRLVPGTMLGRGFAGEFPYAVRGYDGPDGYCVEVDTLVARDTVCGLHLPDGHAVNAQRLGSGPAEVLIVWAGPSAATVELVYASAISIAAPAAVEVPEAGVRVAHVPYFATDLANVMIVRAIGHRGREVNRLAP